MNTTAIDNLDSPRSDAQVRVEVDGLITHALALLDTDPGFSLDLAVKAQGIARSVAYLSGLAASLSVTGRAQHKLARFSQAVNSLCAAGRLYTNLEDESGELEALLELTRVYRSNGDMALAGEGLNRALVLSRESGQRDAEADTLNALAAVSHTLGGADRAMEYLLESLEIRRSIGDVKGEIACLNNLGILRTNTGDYGSAIETLVRCHELIQTRAPDPEAEANCLVNIGNVYQDQRQYDVALTQYRSALGIAHAANLRAIELIALTNLAETRLLEGASHEALCLYEEVFATARQAGYHATEIDALEGMARVNIKREQLTEALEAIDRALEISRTTSDCNREILLLLDLSQTRSLLGDADKAIDAAQQAAQLAEAANTKKLRHDSEVRLSSLHESLGDARAAYAHYKTAHRLERELFSEESDRRLQELTIRFNLEQVRAEAEAYRERTLQIQQANETLERKVLERTQELEDAQIETVTRLALAAEYRDDSTGQHTQRVGDLTALLAEALSLPGELVGSLRIAARLHDVGKIGIADEILLKPDRLDPDEYERMKDHTIIGAQILSGGHSPVLRLAELIALTHHERWDGTGYPKGIAGESIPLVGRIVGVADVYDALTSERPYKRAWSPDEALAELERQSGKMFDPGVIEAARLVLSAGGNPARTPRPGEVATIAPAADASPTVVRPVGKPEEDGFSSDGARAALDLALEQAWELRNTDPKRCERLSRDALARANTLAYRWGMGLGRRNLGFCHFVAAEYEQAIDELTDALEIGRELADQTLVRDCSNYLGAVYSSLGDYSTGIEYVQATLELSRKTGDREGIASSLTNLGLLHHYLGRNEEAASFHRESIVISQKLGDRQREVAGLNNLGIALTDLGRFEEAAETLSQILAVSRDPGQELIKGRTLVNLARVYGHLGRYREALEASEQALGLLRGSGGPESEAQALMAAGIVHFDAGSLDEAAQFLEAAVETAEEINSKALAHQLHEHLSRVHKSAGRLREALEHHERFHALEREVRAEEAERKVRATTAQRETERARAESEIFRLRNVELARAISSLKEADRQKSDLLRELHEKSAELERQVREDGLTGVFNRRHLELALAEEFTRCGQAGLPLSVAMIDVDHFKDVNDTFSHQVGDRVLVEIAALLRKSCRGRDMVARYGGEEFVIAMPETAGAQALVTCERLRRAVEEHDWSGFHPDLRVTISIGLSDDLSVQNHEKLLHQADKQLYEAKRLGRNSVRYEHQH